MVENNNKITKPSQCVLGFGIPTTRSSFTKSLKNPNSDYINRYNCSWNYYKEVIVNPLNDVRPVFDKVGLTIVHNLTLEKFEQLFNEFEVIILFSHWKENKIEFEEGLIEIEKVVDIIPNNFEGVLDLSVCHPTKLGQLIKEQKENCFAKYINIKVNPPVLWFNFYSVLFQYLNYEKKYYLDALEDVIGEFLKSTYEK
jgi:hypothetical protein